MQVVTYNIDLARTVSENSIISSNDTEQISMFFDSAQWKLQLHYAPSGPVSIHVVLSIDSPNLHL